MSDPIYETTSLYAASMATIAMKSVIAGTVALQKDEGKMIPYLAAIAAGTVTAFEKAGIIKTEEMLNDLSEEWKMMNRAMARMIEGNDKKDTRETILDMASDILIQKQAQNILRATNSDERASRLNNSDRNIMEAVKEGGDIEDLVRKRSNARYHDLTLDQQDDIKHDIDSRKMISPDLQRSIDQASQITDLVIAHGSQGLSQTYPPINVERIKKEEDLVKSIVPPVTIAEKAVLLHAKAFGNDDSSKIARAAILGKEALPEKNVYEVALEIQAIKVSVEQARKNVMAGISNSTDRDLAFGRKIDPEHVENIQYPMTDVLSKFILGQAYLETKDKSQGLFLAASQQGKAENGISP